MDELDAATTSQCYGAGVGVWSQNYFEIRSWSRNYLYKNFYKISTTVETYFFCYYCYSIIHFKLGIYRA